MQIKALFELQQEAETKLDELSGYETVNISFSKLITEICDNKECDEQVFTYAADLDLHEINLSLFKNIYDETIEQFTDSDVADIDDKEIFEYAVTTNHASVEETHYFDVKCNGNMSHYNGVSASDFI